MKKFYFNNSDVLMYSVALKKSENKIIVYKYDDIYQVNLAEYSSTSGIKDFKLKTLDNQLVYSVQLNNENKIGNLIIEKNKKFNYFSKKVYFLYLTKHQMESNFYTRNMDDCCRHASGWNECMDCTVGACSNSWVCAVAIVVAGAETLAGFAVSCIGAGAGASC